MFGGGRYGHQRTLAIRIATRTLASDSVISIARFRPSKLSPKVLDLYGCFSSEKPYHDQGDSLLWGRALSEWALWLLLWEGASQCEFTMKKGFPERILRRGGGGLPEDTQKAEIRSLSRTTTTFFDYKICTFRILWSWRFPQKKERRFWMIFLSAPPSKVQILFLLSSRRRL